MGQITAAAVNHKAQALRTMCRTPGVLHDRKKHDLNEVCRRLVRIRNSIMLRGSKTGG